MMTGKRLSKRFIPSAWMDRLVPLLLGLLAIALLATVVVVVLSLIGLTPGV
jgi:hypothetical protein